MDKQAETSGYLNGWVMVICNPVSGMGRGLERLAAVRRTFDAAGVRHMSEITRRRGDPMKMARSAALLGCSAIVAIGGDGTLFEVVNGVMSPAEAGARFGQDIAIGLVQAGRGSDFGRSIGVPSDIEAACARLVAGRTVTIDLGYVTYCSFGGHERARHFINAAGIGFDAEVAARANAGPRVLGGTVPYLSSLFTTLRTYRNKRVQMSLDGAPQRPMEIVTLVVGNGQYFGGGMKIAPDAQLSDGLMDVVVVRDMGKLELIRNVPKLYDGSHIYHPKVDVYRARDIAVESPDKVVLQADGEVLGTGPFAFTTIPGALKLIV